MSEYIKRDDALDLLREPITMSMCLSVDECMSKRWQREIDCALIKAIPAADVVEVVRCKDCKYRVDDWAGCGPCCGNLNAGMTASVELKDDDFCSYGERRDKDARQQDCVRQYGIQQKCI